MSDTAGGEEESRAKARARRLQSDPAALDGGEVAPELTETATADSARVPAAPDPSAEPDGVGLGIGAADDVEAELAAAPVNVDTIDAVVRANAGDDGITSGESAAVQGALQDESRKEARSLRLAAANRLRGTADRLERLADRLERSPAADGATSAQRAARAYHDGRDRYAEQHESPTLE